VSIGQDLAEARRQAGLSLSQVSQQTCIRETIIREIERDEYSACGGDFYARGHIRSIAQAVGTDPAPLIQQYDAARRGQPPARAAELLGPVRPIEFRPRRRRWPGVAALLLSSTLGVGVGFAIIPIIVVQGGLALGAHAVSPLMTPAVIDSITAVGGTLIFAIGFDTLGIKRLPVGNMVPAIAVAAVLGGIFG